MRWQPRFPNWQPRFPKSRLPGFPKVEKRYALAAWLPQLAAWLPQGAGKKMKGGRVLSVRFGTVEKRYALAAWLPQRAAWFPQGYAGLCWICWIGKNRQEKQRSTPTVLLEQWIEKQEDYVEK